MTDVARFIEIECALRRVLDHYGYKTKSDYYKDRDKIAEAIFRTDPAFSQDVGEYIVSLDQQYHIVRSLTAVSGYEIAGKPKFIFTKKTGGKKQ